jgi:hypothetical protein
MAVIDQPDSPVEVISPIRAPISNVGSAHRADIYSGQSIFHSRQKQSLMIVRFCTSNSAQ